MSKKIIPFFKKSAPSSESPIALDSKGPKKSSDGKILDHGTLADLEYEIYERGTIHIFNKELRFKKDIYIFEREIKTVDFGSLQEGSPFIIKGSGDNDHFVFTKENGELKISLEKRKFEVIGVLQDIIKKGKDKISSGGAK